MKGLTAVLLLCLVLLLATVWLRLQPGRDFAVPAAPAAHGAVDDPRREALDAARRQGDAAALDALLAERRRQLDRPPADAPAGAPVDAGAMRLYAEALLERVLLRGRQRGMDVGAAAYAQLPPAVAADLDAAQHWLRRARELGDDSADNWRLEAAVLGNRITGLAEALQWNGAIEADLAKAFAKDPDDPRLHVALGLRRLLAPRLLGHDPASALEHFQFAAPALPGDERPRVFAAMAAWLLRKRQQAIQWLEQASAQNPANEYAAVVLQRLRRDEPMPFARDVTAAEAAAVRAH